MQWQVPAAFEPTARVAHEHRVELFLPRVKMVGKIRVPWSARLTDLVNERDAFLLVSEVHSVPYRPQADLTPASQDSCLVKKSYIDIIAVPADEGQAPDRTARRDFLVEKESHPVLVHTQRFAIRAELQVAKGAELVAMLLHLQPRFLPLIGATITPTHPESALESFRRDFILANSEAIVSIGQDGDSAPTNQGNDGPPAGKA